MFEKTNIYLNYYLINVFEHVKLEKMNFNDRKVA